MTDDIPFWLKERSLRMDPLQCDHQLVYMYTLPKQHPKATNPNSQRVYRCVKCDLRGEGV